MQHQSFSPSRRQIRRRKERCLIEALEQRTMLSVVAVNAATTLRTVPNNFLGINTAPWDGLLSSAQALSLSQAAGINSVRIGGGSYVDANWHFNVNNQSNTLGAQALYVTNLGATGIVDVNYGTASPQEAAAELAYLNGSVSNNTALGSGEQWNTSTSAWTLVDWKTVGYWASLRSAAPLAQNDGLNFLRINHPASFGFHDYEIGNEIYGSWETDEHGVASDTLPMPAGATRAAHDPTTLISFSKQFQVLANQIDPTISIGIDSQDTGTGSGDFNDWIGGILTQSVAQGFTLGYIADHYYTSANPASVSDSTLLATPTTSAGNNSYDLSQRVNAYDTLINSLYVTPLGASANKPQLLVDEFNSVSSNPGKQSVSVVNGLFVADALGAALDTTGTAGLDGAAGVWLWDLHNGPPGGTTPDELSSVYGWRTARGFGDYGILGTSNAGTGTGSGANVKYPDYFALQLAAKLIQAGGTVLGVTSDSTNMDAYSVLEPDGDLVMLVINKNDPRKNGDATTPPNNLPDPGISELFQIAGFTPTGQASIWQYGVAEDDAADNSGAGYSASLTNTNVNLNITGGAFTLAVPDYTMMVIDLKPAAAPVLTAISVTPPSVNVATSSTEQFSAAATDQFGDPIASPIFTWSITGAGNSIDSTGLATLGTTANTYTVTASSSGVQGTATVTTIAPPAITSFAVNDGSAQRAMVTSLTVTFNEPVTLGSGAITLSLRDPNGGPSTAQAFTLSNPSSDQQTYVLTFTAAAADEAGSLPDGVYDLTVHASHITNSVGTAISADQTFSFWRLYADYFGTGTVDFNDLVILAQDFDATAGQAKYVPTMDLDGDGTIGFPELVKLARNFDESISLTSAPGASPLHTAPIINPYSYSASSSSGSDTSPDPLASPSVELKSPEEKL